MRKNFIVILVAVLMNFLIVPTTNAEVSALESSTVKNSDITFCGYGLFAQRKELIRAKIQKNQIVLENNPNDTKARHELASSWHELGRIYYAEEDYGEALTAFNKALDIEPNNAEFKRDRDAALEKLAEKKKDTTPKFNGLG